MNITAAKSAGFCFGVNRAVDMVFDLVNSEKKVYTLGPIIHNPQLVQELSEKGVIITDDLSEVAPDATLVIRSHGVPESVYRKMDALGITYADATCPFVSKIHGIVKAASEHHQTILIAGDESHPEIIGIRGYISTPSYCFKNKEDIEELAQNHPEFSDLELCVVAQTTFSEKEWIKCVKILKKLYTNAKIFATICNATSTRQQEAEELAKKSGLMVIIGGRQSSNTQKLRDVCAQFTKTVLLETADELSLKDFEGVQEVGVTAGASTPARIIKEVLVKMSEILNTSEEKDPAQILSGENALEEASEAVSANIIEGDAPAEASVTEEIAEEALQAAAEDSTSEEAAPATEEVAEEPAAETAEEEPEEVAPPKAFEEMTFEEMIDAYAPNANTDSRIMGIVVGIAPNEVQVDVGRKQAGYIPLAELSADPNVKPEDIVKVGDEIELLIMKTNDQEGTIMLSKKRVDALKGWDTICAAAEDENVILEGTVTEVIRGGILAVTHGVRVFIPASLATLGRIEDLNTLQGQTVRFKILEVNQNRRRAVASVKAVLREEQKSMQSEIWSTIEENKVYTGTVRSLTSYGAFVDIGGVDGMVHISELSWSRIKHPSEVLTVGDTVEVYVKAIDQEKKKISLGYKKTEDNPWEILKSNYSVGQTVPVKIVSLTTFGAFANVIPGIDGLIHISQISYDRVNKPSDVLQVGQELDVQISIIDFENKRINLSIKALLEAPVAETPVADEDVSVFSTEDVAVEETPVVEEAVIAEEAPVVEDAITEEASVEE